MIYNKSVRVGSCFVHDILKMRESDMKNLHINRVRTVDFTLDLLEHRAAQ